jgi:hypothetical protein
VLLEGLSEEVFLVDMHVEPRWVNKLLFPPLIKDKRGEPSMTLRLATLVKWVAELHEAGLKAYTTPKNSPFDEFAPLAIGRN